MSTMSAPGAPRRRPGSDSPTKAVALYLAWAVIYLFAWAAWFHSFYFAVWAGLAPSPTFCEHLLAWSAAGKESGRMPLLLSADPARLPPLKVGSQVQADRLLAQRLELRPYELLSGLLR